MQIKEIIAEIIAGKSLLREDAKNLMQEMTAGSLPSAQMAAVLTAYAVKSVTAEEMLGFREVLLDLAVKPAISHQGLLDVCGTGGDGKDTFNISTLSSFIIAACGQKVAKHGNYASSSHCGSSNVLEALGIKFTADANILNECLEKAGICFLHAPLFHSALKNIAAVRKELGFRTIFNLLGPLVNPLEPEFQFSGVANLSVLRLYEGILKSLGKNYAIAYSYDGYDEISLTGRFILKSSRGDKEYIPEELGLKSFKASDLSGGSDIKEATEIFKNILEGKGTDAQNNIVAVNAAFALNLCKPEKDFKKCFNLALDNIVSGKGVEVLSKVLSYCSLLSLHFIT